jgi:hypothetical protein
LGCYLLGGAEKVTFVLTVFGINEDNHPTAAKLFQHLRYFAKLYSHVLIPYLIFYISSFEL